MSHVYIVFREDAFEKAIFEIYSDEKAARDRRKELEENNPYPLDKGYSVEKHEIKRTV